MSNEHFGTSDNSFAIQAYRFRGSIGSLVDGRTMRAGCVARDSLINLIDLGKQTSSMNKKKKLYDSTIFDHKFHYQRHS